MGFVGGLKHMSKKRYHPTALGIVVVGSNVTPFSQRKNLKFGLELIGQSLPRSRQVV